MFELERLLITVRMYPTISAKHVETVCTGGINGLGQWRRLYPVPLRYLAEDLKYKTFYIVEVKIHESTKDHRPETREPDVATFRVLSHMESWHEKINWVKPSINPSLRKMQSLKKTLAPVAVREVLDFTAKPTTLDWSAKQREKLKQEGLFE